MNAKLNWDLLTDEEKSSPMGLGFLSAAERLGLKYLYDPKVVAEVMLNFANEAWNTNVTNKLQSEEFWPKYNARADDLARIMSGQDSGYMAPPWFTDPHQLAETLKADRTGLYESHHASSFWDSDPIRAACRGYMEFFVDLYDGCLPYVSKDPTNKQLRTTL